MKRGLYFISIIVILVVSAIAMLRGPAHAVSFDLTNWNDPVLDASTDKVTVDVTTAGGITTLVVHWVSGNSGLTAIGIDQFFYDSTVTVATAPATWTAPPASEGFDYTGTFTADGFGSFETRGADPGGTLLTITFVLSGDASTALNSADDFAAHVRYENDCSGFVSGDGRGGTNNTTSNCGSTQVPEPSTLLLLGSGLLGLGLWGRKRFR